MRGQQGSGPGRGAATRAGIDAAFAAAPRVTRVRAAVAKPGVLGNPSTQGVLTVERSNQKILSVGRRYRSAGRSRGGVRGRGCGSAMAESGSCAAVLAYLRRSAPSAGRRQRSTSSRLATCPVQPQCSMVIARISLYRLNHQFRHSSPHRQEIGLKSMGLASTFIFDRDEARKSWVSVPWHAAHLHSIALYPDGLSGPVRRTASSPFAPRPNP